MCHMWPGPHLLCCAENIRWSVMGVLSVLPFINPMVRATPACPAPRPGRNTPESGQRTRPPPLAPLLFIASLVSHPAWVQQPQAMTMNTRSSTHQTPSHSLLLAAKCFNTPAARPPPLPPLQAWVFAALDDDDASTLYYSLAFIYALPYFASGFELDGFAIFSVLLCILHVQASARWGGGGFCLVYSRAHLLC